MYTHIVFDDASAGHLRQYLSKDPELQGELIVFHDDLSVGPITNLTSQKRISWWKKTLIDNKFISALENAESLDDAAKIKSIQNIKTEIYIWLAPIAVDELNFMRITSKLLKLEQNIYIVPIKIQNGRRLSLGEIGLNQISEFIKKRKKVSAQSIQKLITQWAEISQQDSLLRTRSSAFKYLSKPETYYDQKILKYCSDNFQSPISILSNLFSTSKINYDFLMWRIRALIKTQKIISKGDPSILKDFQIKLN